MSNGISTIARNTAEAIMAIYSGRTVNRDAVLAEIDNQYAYANKKATVGSYFAVADACERAGATWKYAGPNYTGELFYTFPA